MLWLLLLIVPSVCHGEQHHQDLSVFVPPHPVVHKSTSGPRLRGVSTFKPADALMPYATVSPIVHRHKASPSASLVPLFSEAEGKPQEGSPPPDDNTTPAPAAGKKPDVASADVDALFARFEEYMNRKIEEVIEKERQELEQELDSFKQQQKEEWWELKEMLDDSFTFSIENIKRRSASRPFK